MKEKNFVASDTSVHSKEKNGIPFCYFIDSFSLLLRYSIFNVRPNCYSLVFVSLSLSLWSFIFNSILYFHSSLSFSFSLSLSLHDFILILWFLFPLFYFSYSVSQNRLHDLSEILRNSVYWFSFKKMVCDEVTYNSKYPRF